MQSAQSIRGLYGYEPDVSFLSGLSASAQADRLASLGANVIFGGYDGPALAAALRERGIRVMAEFGCFAGTDWLLESRPVLSDGSPMVRDGWYCGVDPSHPQVRAELLARLSELLQRWPLDGLWLDFIRWPCHWEAPEPALVETSFAARTVAAFCRDIGVPPVGQGSSAARVLVGELREHWQSWRCAQVTSFCAEAAALVRALQPDCLVGAFTVPWRRDDWDGSLQRVVGQDLLALAEHIDVFSPMVYHRMCGHEPAWIAAVAEDVRTRTGKPVWPIVQSVDEPPGMTRREYRAALDAALATGDGALVFNLRGLEDRGRREATSEAFAAVR
jgi:hypothetical protein